MTDFQVRREGYVRIPTFGPYVGEPALIYYAKELET